MDRYNYDLQIAEIKQEYYSKGVEDGKSKSDEDSLETGFREGISNGIDHGYHIGFINTIKQLITKNSNNIPRYKSKLDKIISTIESTNKEDIDTLKTKIKQIKANLKLVYNKN